MIGYAIITHDMNGIMKCKHAPKKTLMVYLESMLSNENFPFAKVEAF
jgi:hypothetical protein